MEYGLTIPHVQDFSNGVVMWGGLPHRDSHRYG